MMHDIHDRVFEAYVGDLGDNLMRKTRERIHWIAKNIEGDTVLDVGCSQGVLDILLAREGKKVTALDISEKAIAEAKQYISNESTGTKENVEFILSNFILHDFKGQTYHNIVMAEVLEHLTNPEPFVKKASILLKEHAKLIVSVPFGINDFFDHKFTYYFYDIYYLLSRYLQVKEFKILGKWIVFIAENSPINHSEIKFENAILIIEKAFNELERELLTDIKNLRLNLEKSNKKFQESTEQVKQLSNELSSANIKYKESTEQVKHLSDDLFSVNEKYQKSTEQVKQLSDDLFSVNEKYQKSAEQIKQLSDDLFSVNEKYQVNQERLNKLCNTMSYRLRYTISHRLKSKRSLLKLPQKLINTLKIKKKI